MAENVEEDTRWLPRQRVLDAYPGLVPAELDRFVIEGVLPRRVVRINRETGERVERLTSGILFQKPGPLWVSVYEYDVILFQKPGPLWVSVYEYDVTYFEDILVWDCERRLGGAETLEEIIRRRGSGALLLPGVAERLSGVVQGGDDGDT